LLEWICCHRIGKSTEKNMKTQNLITLFSGAPLVVLSPQAIAQTTPVPQPTIRAISAAPSGTLNYKKAGNSHPLEPRFALLPI
jgi:hypothetical protein